MVTAQPVAEQGDGQPSSSAAETEGTLVVTDRLFRTRDSRSGTPHASCLVPREPSPLSEDNCLLRYAVVLTFNVLLPPYSCIGCCCRYRNVRCLPRRVKREQLAGDSKQVPCLEYEVFLFADKRITMYLYVTYYQITQRSVKIKV